MINTFWESSSMSRDSNLNERFYVPNFKKTSVKVRIKRTINLSQWVWIEIIYLKMISYKILKKPYFFNFSNMSVFLRYHCQIYFTENFWILVKHEATINVILNFSENFMVDVKDNINPFAKKKTRLWYSGQQR